MDSLITAAARALAAGDPLGALKRVALRDDAPALALRGIAMAQLGDFARAKTLLRRAARAFGPREAVARARCVVAEAEIALVSRDLKWPVKTLEAARATLEAHGDAVNAAYARYLFVRASAADRAPRRGRARARRIWTLRYYRRRCAPRTSLRWPGSRCGACARRSRARRSHAPSARRRSRGFPRLSAEVESACARAAHARGAAHRERRTSGCCCSRKWRSCRARRRSSSTRVVTSCATRAARCRWRAAPCSSRSRARSARHGLATRREMCSSRRRSERSMRTNRIARDCASRSGGSGGCCAQSRA